MLQITGAQVNRKVDRPEDSPEPDQQFLHITERVKQFHQRHEPVISVDAKNKELLREYSNQGKEWHSKAEPIAANIYDVDKKRGKALPKRVYDRLHPSRLGKSWH